MTSTTLHQDRLARVRKTTADKVTRLWDGLPDYHKDAAAPFAAKASLVVATGQIVAARSTNAYLSRRLNIRPARITPASLVDARKGTTPDQTYQRPFGIVWKALADGHPLDDAIRMGRTRLTTLAVTDVLLAMKVATDLVGGQDQRITGWVRVADGGACDLCSAADGTVYSSADDMGIHPGCGCTLDPVLGDAQSEPDDPEAIDTHQNDELGPVLYEAGHSFEGS